MERRRSPAAAAGRGRAAATATGASTPRRRRAAYFDFTADGYPPLPRDALRCTLARCARAASVVKDNGSASLFDLGDGVLCVEFHTKMNAIDDDIVAMMARRSKRRSRTGARWSSATRRADFSVGANLFALDGRACGSGTCIEKAVTRACRTSTGASNTAPTPVVVAPAGRTLGGGAEIVMHGQTVRAAAETYLGLVEVGAGRHPAGGGCKEMLARWQR